MHLIQPKKKVPCGSCAISRSVSSSLALPSTTTTTPSSSSLVVDNQFHSGSLWSKKPHFLLVLIACFSSICVSLHHVSYINNHVIRTAKPTVTATGTFIQHHDHNMNMNIHQNLHLNLNQQQYDSQPSHRKLQQLPDCTPSTDDGSWVTNIPKPLQYTLITFLILFSAFFSGLTLSMMGLDTTGLEIVMSGDDPVLSRAAAKIYPIRKNGNLLLCTLLLGNVAVNTLLGILMAEITGGTVGFLTSTGLIVIFGEILPQALFSRYALQVGEKAVPLVKIIIVLLYVLAKPLAFCLDKLLGHELGTTYSKSEMSKLLEIHVKEGRFNQEIGTAMKGALQYQDMVVSEVMTPIENTFMINVDDRLTFETMTTIFKTGYSRIPVYESHVENVIGLLFVKDLIFIDPEDGTSVRNLMPIFGRRTHFVWPDDKLGDVLRHLKQGHTHMAFVRSVVEDENSIKDPYYKLDGIVTLEDIIEIILGEEIVDETDAWVDADHTKEVNREKSFDWSRLRLLDSKIVDQTLSEDEVRAVSAHLRQNYRETVTQLSDKQLIRMIAATAVTEFQEIQKEAGERLPVPSKLLYEKNKKSDRCILILNGKVTILAGNENFRSDLSSWSVIACSALTDENYAPDFSAFVSSGPCRCLQFTRDIFKAACDASALGMLPVKGLGNNLIDSCGDGELEMSKTSIGVTSSDIQQDTDSANQNELNAPQSDNQNPLLASSNHTSTTMALNKAEDMVERSELRGRLLATLLDHGITKNIQLDTTTENGNE